MKKWAFSLMATICMFANVVYGQHAGDLVPDGAVVGPELAACGNACCCSGGWVADIEATFFRYHRGDGVHASLNNANLESDPAEFDFEIAPRVTIGYVSCDGLGIRLRGWEYNHGSSIAAGSVSVDTFVLDAEVYEEISLSCATSVEVSAGLRYVDFSETIVDFNGATNRGESAFSGYGITMALEARRDSCLGRLYARSRGAILMSDRKIEAAGAAQETLIDVTPFQIELATGVEKCVCLGCGAIATVRAGVEMQVWDDFVIGRGDYNLGDSITGTNAGFGGFVLGATLNY